MNIQTLTSSKSYNNNSNSNNNSNNNYLNVCPSDDAGLKRYSSSPPTTTSTRFYGKSPVKSPSIVTYNMTPSPPSPSYHHNNSTDLQSVVQKYHANPELLKLILASKVEEDKRRTEEAKLRAKELDLYFQQQQQQQQQQQVELAIKKDTTTTNRNSLLYQKNGDLEPNNRRRSSSSSSTSSSNGSTTIGAVDSIHRRIAPYSIPRPIAISNNSNNNNSNHIPRRNSSASSALLSINRLSIHQSQQQQQQQQQQYNSNHSGTGFPIHHQQQQQQTSGMASSAPSSMLSQQYLYQTPSSSNSSNSNNNNMIRTSPDNKIGQQPVIKTSRRRRSMQAISKIVETSDNPYDDGHFWKNNGNTVQKKTGCKSVYYKCANSCKGCPVNKTVIEQLDGSFLIKYRGDHISECSQVEHIRDL